MPAYLFCLITIYLFLNFFATIDIDTLYTVAKKFRKTIGIYLE